MRFVHHDIGDFAQGEAVALGQAEPEFSGDGLYYKHKPLTRKNCGGALQLKAFGD